MYGVDSPFSNSHHSRDITRWGHYNLVGGFNPSEKYESQLRSLFPYIMEHQIIKSKPPTTYSMLMYVMVPLDIAIPSISYGLRPSPNLVVKSNFSPWPMRKIGYGCTNMSHKQNSIVNNPDVFHDIPTCVTCKFWFWSILIYCPCNMLQDEPSPVISWFINSLPILISSRIPTKLCASTWLSSWPHQNYPLQKICIRPLWPLGSFGRSLLTNPYGPRYFYVLKNLQVIQILKSSKSSVLFSFRETRGKKKRIPCMALHPPFYSDCFPARWYPQKLQLYLP